MVVKLNQKTTVVVIWCAVLHIRIKAAEGTSVHKDTVNVLTQYHGQVIGKARYGEKGFCAVTVAYGDLAANRKP